MLRLLLTSY